MQRLCLPIGLATLTALLVAAAGCRPAGSSPTQSPEATASPAPTRVTAAAPARKTLRRECVQPGQIEAFEHTALYAKFPAYVQKLHVDIGDRVEADQLLVDLFLPELKEELRQKEAAVSQSHAEMEHAAAAVQAAEAAVATAQAHIHEADAGRTRAEADRTRWQSQLARIRGLVASGSVDRKLEDETQNAFQAAEAACGETLAKIESAKATLVETQAGVAKAKASHSVAVARRDSAQADLSRQKALLQYTQLRAPYSGVVTERNVNRGDFVQPATTATAKPLVAVARTDLVRIFLDVSEKDSPGAEPGRTGRVRVQALPDQIVEGKVARTSWILSAHRTLRTELDLPNPNGLLRPGMYATGTIVLQERPDVYVLPLSAVVREGNQAYCWVVQEGQAVRAPITLGLQAGDEVEVASGLAGSEQVVQSQIASLRQGQPVTTD